MRMFALLQPPLSEASLQGVLYTRTRHTFLVVVAVMLEMLLQHLLFAMLPNPAISPLLYKLPVLSLRWKLSRCPFHQVGISMRFTVVEFHSHLVLALGAFLKAGTLQLGTLLPGACRHPLGPSSVLLRPAPALFGHASPMWTGEGFRAPSACLLP